jgi:predicted ribosome quality control (RQC) complex YloA/Tae2 family protein
MDQFLLQAVVFEAADRLLEQEVLRVSHLGRLRYLIRFATAARDNLLISVRPDLPRLHLVIREKRVREEPPDRFAACLDQAIGGSVLASIEKRPWDRIVEMRFRAPRGGEDQAGWRRLVVELVGRSANVLLLDGDGTILGHCRDLRSELRAPGVGAAYRPPPGREEYEDIPLSPDAVPLIRRRFGDPGAFLGRVSPLIEREMRWAAAAGASGDTEEGRARQDEALAAILATARDGTWSPTVHAIRPLEELGEGDVLGRDAVVVAPLRLGSVATGATAVAILYASPSEAAEAGFGLLERLRDLRGLLDHHRSLVRKEIDRLQALAGKLEGELQKARDCERYRRLGEGLLAGLRAARVEGKTASVPDPRDPDGPPLAVPIDPGLSLQDNAQALFGRYKKAKRGLATIEARLEAARQRLREWSDLLAPSEAARTGEDLDRLREAMGRLGLVHAPRPRRDAAPPRPRESPARVRRHTSPDGLDILVGKSGAENDTLTFRVASPWDFWLHAAERPGAHVVVRNPRRLKSIPEPTLRLAAEIAAFYSGARREGKVDVHYTQRKHVHKRRGAPAGQVLLRRFRTIQVTPRLPVPSAQDV